MIRVHVAHDVRLLCEAVADALVREPGLSVVGASAGGAEGLVAVKRSRASSC